MNRIHHILLTSCILLTTQPAFADSFAHLSLKTARGDVPIKTWKALRDQDIEKQDQDFSCGSAAAATILKSFYGRDISEQDILKKVKEIGGDGTASFSDLATAVESFGFKGIGLSLSFEKFKTIQIPAIVYLHYKNNDHFSVIRGIGKNGLTWLGDPSLGNRKFTEHQFKMLWETRNDPQLKGKILLIIPKNKSDVSMHNHFFSAPTINKTATELLTLRN